MASHSHGPVHGHGHRHGHAHGASLARASERHRRPLTIALCLVLLYLAVQVVAAFASRSLTLLSDAGHMATDALGLGLALVAIRIASRPSDDSSRTFGSFRLEILAALANAVLLLAMAAYVLVEAVLRIGEPPEVASLSVLVVGAIGLGVNVVSFLLLRQGAAESLNVRGAYTEVLADLVGSVGVIAAALAMWATGWQWIDPVVGAGIGLFIVPRAYRLGRDSLRVLLQHAPAHLDVGEVKADLAGIDGVTGVHDVHLWTLTSDMDVLTAHLVHGEGVDSHGVLDRARELLQERYGVHHATLQVEPADHEGCDQVDW